MKMTINANTMEHMFKRYDRDYYSFSGYETLLDYYDEIDENMEIDVIAICCDCSEFGNNCTLSFDNLIDDYGYMYTFEEWKEDVFLDENDEMGEDEKEDYIKALVECLENHTTVLYVPNGNYIVFAF